jgi:hypothetical protein
MLDSSKLTDPRKVETVKKQLNDLDKELEALEKTKEEKRFRQSGDVNERLGGTIASEGSF